MTAFLAMAFFISQTFSQTEGRTKSFTIVVNGNCEQCKERIEETMGRSGAIGAIWDMRTHNLTFQLDTSQTSLAKIAKGLAKAGHDNSGAMTTAKAYSGLPECCHYDRKKLLAATESTIERHSLKGFRSGKAIDFHGKPIAWAAIGSVGNAVPILLTDSTGEFNIPVTDTNQLFWIRSEGYGIDTFRLQAGSATMLKLQRANPHDLGEVTVRNTPGKFSAYVSTVSTLNTLQIGTRELTKAACCNLSESFETTPSVDVSYSDAATGLKQVQLLGLSGNYTFLTSENIPDNKGLSGPYAMGFVPGPWLESVQLTKGTGSVANGYEGIAGQINIEATKPWKTDRTIANIYANGFGRKEASITHTDKVTSRWSTAIMAHGNQTNLKMDANQDGFLDMPLGKQWNVAERWHYADGKGVTLQFGAKALKDERQAGETGFDANTDKLGKTRYGVGSDIEQYSAFAKAGIVLKGKSYRSFGLMVSAKQFDQESYYGPQAYKGNQSSYYANGLYQADLFGGTAHKIKTGISYSQDKFNETFVGTVYFRQEILAGAFGEYTFSPNKQFTAILGLRSDHHDHFGWLHTPRLNLKYNSSRHYTFRLSAGKGYRVANVLAENTGVLVSARQFTIVPGRNDGYGFGLGPEAAWNFGAGIGKEFTAFGRKGTVSLDLYRTDFVHQTIVDLDASPQKAIVQELNGASFSNSLHVESNYEAFEGFDIRLAYRYLDSKTTYSNGLLERPLLAPHRAFVNLAYNTKKGFKFDLTGQWISAKRLPSTKTNPIDKQFPDYSPSFVTLFGQVTKTFGSRWEVYVGWENLTGYTQSQLFLDNTAPFGNYFDGSMVWGPVNGRMGYIGARMLLAKPIRPLLKKSE